MMHRRATYATAIAALVLALLGCENEDNEVPAEVPPVEAPTEELSPDDS